MKTLQESIIGRKGSYQKMKISDLKPGDVLKIKSDYDGSREYDYLLLISGDDYYKLFKRNYADLVIIVDPYSGRITRVKFGMISLKINANHIISSTEIL